MSRRALVVALLALAITGTAAPAGAGGWWNYVDFDKNHVTVGDRMTERGEVLFATVSDVDVARDHGYFMYLVRGMNRRLIEEAMGESDPKRWWSQPQMAVRMGKVHLGRADSNLVFWKAVVAVPDVPPGRYAVMLCDAGCRKPLAGSLPFEGLHVYTAGREAVARSRQTMSTLEQFRDDAQGMDESLAAENDTLREDVARVGGLAARADSTAERAQADVTRLEGELAALRADQPSPWPARAGWIVAALLALALIASWLRRGGEPAATGPPVPPEDANDDRWELAGRR